MEPLKLECIKKEIITYGDRVRIKKQGYVGIEGKIRFLGAMESKKGIYYGIELDKKNGKYDGSFLNKKYFECDARKGLFLTILNMDKLVKKSKTMPRVTINSVVYINKYSSEGIIKYIGIPCIEKNKSKNIYYGIELKQAKGKNNGCIGKTRYFKCNNKCGIFVKKDKITSTQNITPGGPVPVPVHAQSVSIQNKPSKPIKPIKSIAIKSIKGYKRNGRKDRTNTDKKKFKNMLGKPIEIKRSKSITAKTKKRLKKKNAFNKSRPTSPDLNANKAKKIKSEKANKQINVAKFKRNGKKNKNKNKNNNISKTRGKSRRRARTDDANKKSVKSSAKPRTKSAAPAVNTKKIQAKHVTQSMTPKSNTMTNNMNDNHDSTPGYEAMKSIESMESLDIHREEKGENDFYDGNECDEMIIDLNNTHEIEAIRIINETLSLTNYRLFIEYITDIRDSICKLNRERRAKILNHISMICHENNILIWQNILHLSLLIVKSMHSFYSLAEKKQMWDFVDFLLQNGSDPLIKMTIKQKDTYEHKNVFRLMNDALKAYKQNEMLIVKRFNWLWSLVSETFMLSECEHKNNAIFSDCDEDFECNQYILHRLNKPAILTVDSSYNNHWIIADGYDDIPSPKILKQYIDFGCDLIHFCSDDCIYYDFNQIRLSMPPGLIITTLRINYDMRFYFDFIGRIVLYYKYYKQQRCNDMMQIYKQLMRAQSYPKITNHIMQEIMSFSTTNIVYCDHKISEIDLIAYTLCKIPNYGIEWSDFLYKNVICTLSDDRKYKLKKLTKTWENQNEWDYFISKNIYKNKQQFLCFLDVFEYVIGYKTAQKITDYYLQKNNKIIVQQYMLNQNAFKYLELYNLLFNYDLGKNESANYIFAKLIDLVTNRHHKKQSKSNARKELSNLYVQFCRHEVNDWMFQNNFLYIFKQLLPCNLLLAKNNERKSNRKSKKIYKFDFSQAILHCFKAKQLNTLAFLMENGLVINVEKALLKFYVDDVIKRIIYGMDEFDEIQEDFLKLILNWSWQYTKNKNDMKTWYVKWLSDAQLIEDKDCIQIFQSYCNLSDNMV